MTTLIEPHGAAELKPLFVQDELERARLKKAAESLQSVVISSATAGTEFQLFRNRLPGNVPYGGPDSKRNFAQRLETGRRLPNTKSNAPGP